MLRLSAATVALFALTAVLAPWLAPFPPEAQDLPAMLSSPSRAHPLGADELGRDVLSRLMSGARLSLALGLGVVAVCAAVGTVLGTAAGLRGGWLDEALMRCIDVLLAFPGLLLAIALVAVLGPDLRNTVLALCLIGWVGYARLSRAQALSLREREFVAAARAAGAGSARLLARHLIPNLFGPVLVQATLGVGGIVAAEASLSFLGLGAQPPAASWGSMLRAGTQHFLDAPHLALFPGAAIAALVLAFSFLGDALAGRLDPRRSDADWRSF
jgi:peptide/nickel transport system permease protein